MQPDNWSKQLQIPTGSHISRLPSVMSFTHMLFILPQGSLVNYRKASFRFLCVVCFSHYKAMLGLVQGLTKLTNILSKESCTLIGNWNPVFAFDIQLIFSCSKLLFKFVDVCHLHSVHQGQSLGAEDRGTVRVMKRTDCQSLKNTVVIQKLLSHLKNCNDLKHNYNKFSIDMLSFIFTNRNILENRRNQCILNSTPCPTQLCVQNTETQWQVWVLDWGCTVHLLRQKIQVLGLTTGWIWNSTKWESFFLENLPQIKRLRKREQMESFLKWNQHLPQVHRLHWEGGSKPVKESTLSPQVPSQ